MRQDNEALGVSGGFAACTRSLTLARYLCRLRLCFNRLCALHLRSPCLRGVACKSTSFKDSDASHCGSISTPHLWVGRLVLRLLFEARRWRCGWPRGLVAIGSGRGACGGWPRTGSLLVGRQGLEHSLTRSHLSKTQFLHTILKPRNTLQRAWNTPFSKPSSRAAFRLAQIRAVDRNTFVAGLP